MFVVTVVVSVLLAVVAIGSAAGKLSRQAPVVEMLGRIGVPDPWLPRLAAAELAGGVGLLVGLALAPLGIAAAAGLTCYFIGAVITHVRAKDTQFAAPLALAIVAVVALVLRTASM